MSDGDKQILDNFWSRFNRKARCGACGTERDVTPFMKRDEWQQFTPRASEPMDTFYCGCQDE